MSYTIKNLASVEDSAPRFGFAEIGEAHFARHALDAERTGVVYHVLRPNRRQAFAHRHDAAEEIAVVISGGGRVKLEDEVHELRALDAVRLSPEVRRQFEAGPEGMAYVVFGPHHERDGELIHDGFWEDSARRPRRPRGTSVPRPRDASAQSCASSRSPLGVPHPVQQSQPVRAR